MIDFLRGAKVAVMGILLGSVFCYLGLSNGFQGFGISLEVGESRRTISLVLGSLLLVASLLLEVYRASRGSLRKGANGQSSSSAKQVAQGFFYTLDDRSVEHFPSFVQGAKTVLVLSRTAVNLMNLYSAALEQLLKSGCKVRLLFVDPSSEAATYIYGNKSDVYRRNIASSSEHLIDLMAIGGSSLELRWTKHAPTASMIIVEKEKSSDGFINVQLYFLHSAVGRDRPVFRVLQDDRWYNVFRAEFDQLWTEGTVVEVAELQDLRG